MISKPTKICYGNVELKDLPDFLSLCFSQKDSLAEELEFHCFDLRHTNGQRINYELQINFGRDTDESNEETYNKMFFYLLIVAHYTGTDEKPEAIIFEEFFYQFSEEYENIFETFDGIINDAEIRVSMDDRLIWKVQKFMKVASPVKIA